MMIDIDHTSFFFFEAEDGIRDSSVTGVQTCARPICPNGVVLAAAGWSPHEGVDAPAPAGQPFSLLLAVWGGDDPQFLRDAFTSSVQEQTRPPAQVVLVQDGPVPDELAAEIRALVEV